MDEIYDRIDLYVLGEMSDNEKSVFEEEMAKDQELASEVGNRRLLIIGMRAQEAENLYWQKQSERIDKYLLHEMPDHEIEAFEEQLKWDTELRSHLETQRFIMTGFRLEAASDAIADFHAHAYTLHSSDIFFSKFVMPDSDSKEIRVDHNRHISRYITIIAAAACLCLLVMITGHFVGKSYGSEAFDNVYRSSDEVTTLVNEEKYDEAIVILNARIDAMELALEDNPAIQNDIIQAKYELASVFLMEGEIPKAKKVLKSMEYLYYNNEYKSPQSEKAEELYNKLWWILW